MLTFPIAKINLGLHVVGRRADGYHDIETIFYPIPLTDTLETRPQPLATQPYTLQTVGIPVQGDPDDNLVVRAYRLLREEFDLQPVDFYLDKHIPSGAGLGGGSSDAAEALLHLNEVFHLDLTARALEQRAARLGADCPFFIRKRPVYATGIGDEFAPVDVSLKGKYLALVKPAIHVSTAEAYAGIEPAPSTIDLREAVQMDCRLWRQWVKNDFETTVFNKYPRIEAIKDTLYDMGAIYASMSGSGSAIYGLFDHRMEELERVFSDCFTFQARLLK